MASFLVFFMQPGFALLEAGQVQAKNVANVAMKNLMDWSQGVLSYFLIGSGVAYLVGSATSPNSMSVATAFAYLNDPTAWIGWLFGAVFAMTAATIVSGAVAGRIKFAAYVAFGFLVVSVIYPVVQGLAWQGGLLTAEGYLGTALGVAYIDFAGATVVHMTGGVAGLVAAWMVGPRRIRYGEGSLGVVPGHSVFLSMLGTFVLAFGWYGFNVGTHATVLTSTGGFEGAALGRVALNTTLAMGAGTMASALVTATYRGGSDPLFAANGMLAGLVAVTGAASHVTWWAGILLGTVGGAMVMPVHRIVVDRFRIDDVCSVFAVHGFSGAIGTLLVPFLAIGPDGSWQPLGIDQFVMQATGIGVIALWTVVATLLSLTAISVVLGGLRVDEQAEQQGLDASEHNITAYPEFALTDGGFDAVAATDDSGGSSETETGRSTTMWRGQEVEISRKTEYERELEALTERFELALEETDTGVWELDVETNEYVIDEASERLLGTDGDSSPDTYEAFLDRVHPEDRARVADGIDDAIADTETEYDSEFRVQRPDGTVRWIRARGDVHYEDGEPTRILGIQTDVTERVERERELRRTNERLDNFAGFVSHDLRNPLGVARTYLDFARESGEADDFEAVEESLQRMDEMIDGFLALANIDAESLDREDVSLATSAENAWAGVETVDASLELETDATVSADPEFLLHVFENLFRNAVEHGSTSSRTASDDAVEHGSTSPDSQTRQDAVEHGSTSSQSGTDDAVEHGGEDVTVWVGTLADGFYVADDGPGIPEAEREAVLEHGYTNSETGSGFGLSIVTTVVDVHDWSLAVTESTSGGARFEFRTGSGSSGDSP